MSFGFTNFPNGLSPGSKSNFLVRFVLTFDFVKNVSSKGDKFELVSSFPIFLDFQINFKAPVANILGSFLKVLIHLCPLLDRAEPFNN